jgi:RNA polymerase sigma factor (TIGR02999 family)
MLPAQLQLLIQSAESGDPGAREQLFAALYQELHRLAQRELRRNAFLTMSPTTLLHETYLNLSERDAVSFPDRAHFLAYASRAMRGLLIDYVRSRRAQKRGGAFEITALPTEIPAGDAGTDQLDGLGEALEARGPEERLAYIVDLSSSAGSHLRKLRSCSNLGAHGDVTGISADPAAAVSA